MISTQQQHYWQLNISSEWAKPTPMDEVALLGLGLQADCQAQQRSAQYFEELKRSDEGWQLCLKALVSGKYDSNDHVRFFCLQVIEHYLKTRYVAAPDEQQQSLRLFLLSWFTRLTSNTPICNGADGTGITAEKSFVLNKVAQLFTCACMVDYPRRWPAFFDNLVGSLSLGSAAVDLCLRILLAIDGEVVDRDIAHTEQELQRNTEIKDAMRQQCIVSLVNSWYQIITTYEQSKPALVCMCLDVIGAYVSWIDVGLIANDRFVAVLMRFMSAPLLRESACDCVHEIICKGMDPAAKTSLIESFVAVFKTAGLLNVSEDEDGDFLAKLAKLVNGMGLQLIQCWQKLLKSKDEAGTQASLTAIEGKLPYVLKFLNSSDDDVSGTIAPFAHTYITLLKQIAPINVQQKAFVKDLLYVIINKMKYEDLFSFDIEGEEEAMFQEYRKELKVIFNNIGALDGEMLLSLVHELVAQTFSRWQTAEVQDVELAITLLYQLGEALPASHSQHFSGDVSKATALQEMMKLLITSRVSCCNHPAVQLQFFETVVRYEKFFATEPQFLPDVLMAFLDERGLWNASAQVCSRTSYLFSRFVKSVNKVQLQAYLEHILERMHGLLTLNSPFNGVKQCLSPEDQQFMYETAGILIVQSQFTPERKQELMRHLLAPIVTKFDELLRCMIAEPDEARQAAYAVCINQAMGFASRSSKGFSGQQTVKANGCVDVYVETLTVFLHVLNVPVQRSLLHQGVRQFLHRMVVCLGSAILQFIPVAMESLLKSADVRELYDFIPFVNQVVQKFKKEIVPFLQQVFMPIVSTIFRALTTAIDERDQVSLAERKLLQRGYFTFISTLVNNNVTEVLSNQSAQNLQEVLATVVHGAVEIPDPIGQKACFGILRKLVEVWGDDRTSLSFNDFIYKSIIPACFMAPMKSTFDLSDAQAILALNECASCLKTVYDKRGTEFLVFLQTDYLPTHSLPQPAIQEFCRMLVADTKVFHNYYKTFFMQVRS